MCFKENINYILGNILLYILWYLSPVRKVKMVGRYYFEVLVYLIKKGGLFNQEYYFNSNEDVQDSDYSGLRHYVMYGDREGRFPLELFDPTYYSSKTNDKKVKINSLLHYMYSGRYKGLSPSPWFDIKYYLNNNKDVRRSGIEPLYHFLCWGGVEGRSPNSQFDTMFYLNKNPKIRQQGINPLLHYLRKGRQDDLATRACLEKDSNIDDIRIHEIDLNSEAWKGVTKSLNSAPPIVDIIIPVYKDIQLTLRCIRSVLINNVSTSYELIVINDESPEPELSQALRVLSDRKLITLLENSENKGFVGTVNRGMQLHTERDIVLLNSDAEVFNDWLDRIINIKNRTSKMASVTPLSNNATICSYPRFLHDNPYPLEIDSGCLDKIAAKVNKDIMVESPTGVGFCMFMSRKAIDAVGYFDEKTFGKGYGEENDWCQRVIKKGFTNIIAADVFVKHYGSASFQGEKSKRVSAAMKILSDLHPTYHDSVHQFIKNDPLREARANIDLARLGAQSKYKNTLILSHNRGGGSERHVQEDTVELQKQGEGVFFLRPKQGTPSKVKLSHPECKQLLNIPAIEFSDTQSLLSILKDLNITSVHSHGLVDYEADAPLYVSLLTKSLGIPLLIDIHDYKVICPRINLVDKKGVYCGEPGEEKCNKCLIKNGNDFGARNITLWRDTHHKVLAEASDIFVPDSDVAHRLQKYYSDIHFKISPHNDLEVDKIKITHRSIDKNKPLKVVIIGAIGAIKGFHVLLRCAEDVSKNNYPIEFIVMGFTQNNRLAEKAGIKVLGRYDDSEADKVLQDIDADIVWLPSTWPETYSYTLSLALRHDLPVFAFNMGAIASRLHACNDTSGLMPLDFINKPKEITKTFMEYRTKRIKGQVKVCDEATG